ncbi:MAG: patatin-like phospholipase family protein [Leptospirales bacterium]
MNPNEGETGIPASLKKGFVLVLSGGAARGMAHLGFLDACRGKGLPVRAIVASSAGAIAGSLFASSKCTIEMVRKRILGLTKREMFRFAWSMNGVFESTHIADLLGDLIGAETTFKDLFYPLSVTATSLWSRKMILLDSGEVGPAVAASSALPPFFTPVSLNGDRFVDGGLISILPVMAAKARFPQTPVVSVNVNDLYDVQTVPFPYPDTTETPAGVRPISGNWLTLPLRLYGLGLYRTLQIETSFSDWYIGISGGRFPMSAISSMDKLFQLGYDSGEQFVRLFDA